jgi:hypothetical protein
MVWCGVWDTVRNVGACPGQDSTYWTPSPNAPEWYNWFFDSNWPTSLVNYVSAFSNSELVLDADTSDVYVRDRTTRERFNYYTVCPLVPDSSEPTFIPREYAQLVLAELDDTVDFGMYSSEDSTVDLLIFMMDWPYDHGKALGAWSPASNYETNDDRPGGGHYWIMWTRTINVYVDPRREPDDVRQGDWNGILTHEFSHMIRIDHENPSLGNGLGQFTLMTGEAGFRDAAGYLIPSLYHPAIITGRYKNSYPQASNFYYSLPDCVTTSQQSLTLSDFYTTRDAIMVVPDIFRSYSSLEYFLITNHRRVSAFERNWPGRGILVTHVDRLGNMTDDRLHKEFDLELPTGLWNWTSSPTSPDTGQRTDMANTARGLDSLDFKYGVRDGVVVPMFSRGAGSASCFWGVGQEFGPATNPNSNRYAGSSQLTATAIDIQMIGLDTASGVFTLNALTDRWAGTYSHDATWHDTVKVVSNVTFGDEATLTIDPGTVIRVTQGASIGGHGQIIANGTAAHPIVFSGLNGATWSGLTLHADGNEFSYCTFNNVSTAITANSGTTALRRCNINDAWMGAMVYSGANVTLDTCHISVHGPYGILSLSSLTLNSTIIQDASRAGLWTARGLATINKSTFLANGAIEDSSVCDGGIRNTFAAIMMSRSALYDNLGPGLSCLGGTADLGGGRRFREVAGNCIHDNRGNAVILAQIYRCNGGLNLALGRNAIYNDLGWLVRDCNNNAVEDVRSNFWNDRERDTTALPRNYLYDPVDTFVPVCDLDNDTIPPLIGEDSTQATLLFHNAFDNEFNLQYALAIAQYDSVLEFYPVSPEAEQCPDRLVACEAWYGKDYAGLREHLLSLIDTTKSEEIEFELRASAAWCLVEMDEYVDAEDELADLLNDADRDYEYQKASILSLIEEIEKSSIDLTDGKVARSPESRLASVFDRVDAALKGKPESRPSLVVPTRYALYQNYPNPFNAVTMVRFDLPKRSDVRLEVFDLTGRLAATLIESSLEAGPHSVQFNGENLSSGMYFCRLRAGNVQRVQKLLLLK